MLPTIEGTCDARFGRVRQAFEEGFASRGELGASIAITIDGRHVVDLWGGHVDKEKTRPWQQDTLVNVFSTTKGITAIAALHLAESGALDLDAPVVLYWPELARTHAQKSTIRVRDFLDHRAALPAVERQLPLEALYDWSAMIAALEEQAPWWEPGTQHGYHAITYGWLVGEVVRRVSGKTVGAYFDEHVARPLGLDFTMGLPRDREARVSDVRGAAPPKPGERSIVAEIMAAPQSLVAKVFANPAPLNPILVNARPYRDVELPAVNGHTTARSLARLYGALACGGAVDGVRVLAPETIARATTEMSAGHDVVLGEPTRFGLGFMLSQPDRPGAAFGPSARAFGHPGAGGSLGFADPDAHIGFGYTMNKMGSRIMLDPRAIALIDALYASL